MPDTSVTAGDSSLYEAGDSAYSGSVEEYEAPEPAAIVVYNEAGPTPQQWQKATTDKVYGYRDKREYVKSAKDDKPEKEPGWVTGIKRFFEYLGTPFGQTILWSVFILIVGYIAWRIIAGQGIFGKRDRKKEASDDAGNISEEGLLEGDWESLLQAALTAGEVRLAIRFSYMDLLQRLQQRGLIAYRPDKTNTAYYGELTESMKHPFRTVSRQYEYTWYGNFLPGPGVMERYMQTYNGLKKTITFA